MNEKEYEIEKIGRYKLYKCKNCKCYFATLEDFNIHICILWHNTPKHSKNKF